MIFSDAIWLWGLLLLPVVGLLEWWGLSRSRKALARLVGERDRHVLLAQRRAGDRSVGALLRLLALALLVLGAARPEWGREVVRRGATGSDVVFVVDASASMDARDVPPSRSAEARREALAVLDRLAGSRVGVVAFAGDAVRLCPLTLDRATARLILEGLSSSSISMPGTDLGKALRMALRVLPGGRREEQVIVLWTDGEDLEAQGRAAIEDVARAGVRVFAVGVGSPAGDVIPVLDAEGRATDVKRDDQGRLVKSRLDEGLLRAVARRTHGGYFSASRPGGELPRLLGALGTVSRAARGQRLIERPRSGFGWFAILAAALLAFDRVRARRRREAVAESVSLHGQSGAAAAAATATATVLLLVGLSAGRAEAQSAWARADRAFRAGRFAEAESLYGQRLKRGGPEAVRINRATAKALTGAVDDAVHDLEPLSHGAGRPSGEAGYNLGTLLGQKKEYDPALAALRRVLERDPKDDDARWNFETLMSRKREDERRSSPESRPAEPKPSPSSGGGNTRPAEPANSAPANRPPPPGQSPTPPKGAGSGAMSRREAEQLLDALQELSRVEQQRQRRVKVLRERQGKDW